MRSSTGLVPDALSPQNVVLHFNFSALGHSSQPPSHPRGKIYTGTPSHTAVLGCSSPASKTEMFDDDTIARAAHRRPQRQVPQEPGDRGRTFMTAGVNTKGPEFVAKALIKVIAFDDFNADNDPHHEHDFGSFELEGEKLFSKIDLYERELVKQALTGTPYEHRLIGGTVHPCRVTPTTCRTRAEPGTPLPCRDLKFFVTSNRPTNSGRGTNFVAPDQRTFGTL